jgi:hypothetical protein
MLEAEESGKGGGLGRRYGEFGISSSVSLRHIVCMLDGELGTGTKDKEAALSSSTVRSSEFISAFLTFHDCFYSFNDRGQVS